MTAPGVVTRPEQEGLTTQQIATVRPNASVAETPPGLRSPQNTGAIPTSARSKISDFMPKNLMIGSELPVSLVSLTSFNSFGVQLTSNSDAFEALKKEMLEFYGVPQNRDRMAVRIENVKPG